MPEPLPTIPPPLPPFDAAPAPPLWRELADGTASRPVKLFVSIALAPLLVGFALLSSYILAGLVPGWWRLWGPDEDLIACLLVIFGLVYIGAVAWVWTRNRRRYGTLWKAGFATGGIVIATIAVCVVIDSAMRRGADALNFAIVCFAMAGITLLWIEAARRHARGEPIMNAEDGTLDVRCPTCGYRMVGLHECRCPECGTGYTLDELLARQAFLSPAQRVRGAIDLPSATDPHHNASSKFKQVASTR